MKKIKTHKRKVLSHKFNGVKYDISVDEPPYAGDCGKPHRPKKYRPEISLTDGLPCGDERGAKNGLIYLLHECLHAENWSKYEGIVERTAEDIGKLLWRLGFRRIK